MGFIRSISIYVGVESSVTLPPCDDFDKLASSTPLHYLNEVRPYVNKPLCIKYSVVSVLFESENNSSVMVLVHYLIGTHVVFCLANKVYGSQRPLLI